MGNVIQLRRPVTVGNKVKLLLGINKQACLIYTVTRVVGRVLFGVLEDDSNPIKEHCITKDYRKVVRRIIEGKEVSLYITHIDGRHIQ